MSNPAQRVWNTAIYIRVSKENGDDTLENQLFSVTEHLKKLGDTKICTVKIDDGYSGLNIDRPAFQEMLNEIRCGSIDCVAVRDLSRLSKDHIEAGRYIHRIFPAQGVRFLSALEDLDFTKAPEYSESLMLDVKNLMNEEYSRHLSRNIRSVFQQKYMNGKYIGAFAIYGYFKSPEDKNKLVVDETVASVVKDIFQWKLDGMSAADIAEELNQNDIPSPAEHKKSTNYHLGFQTNEKMRWSSVAVARILANRVYTGCLEQAKSMSHFKVGIRVIKPTNEWIRIESSHEAIIPATQYEAVTRLLRRDARKSPGEKLMSALAGFVRCKSCGQNMKLQQVGIKGRTYRYYVCCGKNKDNRSCPAHRITKNGLKETVLQQIRIHVDDVKKADKIDFADNDALIVEMKKQEIEAKICQIKSDLKLTQTYLEKLQDMFVRRKFSRSDFNHMRLHYEQKCSEIKEELRTEESNMQKNLNMEAIFGWTDRYRPFFSFEEFTRPLLAYLVQRITVDRNKQVKIEFVYEQEYEFLQKFLRFIKS